MLHTPPPSVSTTPSSNNNTNTSGAAAEKSCKRKVRFQVCKYTYFEPGLEQEIALDNKEELFYTQTDYGRMEDESKETQRRMMKKSKSSSPFSSSPAKIEKNFVLKRNLSTRGLEERMPHVAREQAHIRRKAIRVVLLLQKLQKENGDTIMDNTVAERVIAKKYRKIAAPTVRDSHLIGLQDEVFAKWIYEGCPEVEEEKKKEGKPPTHNKVINSLNSISNNNKNKVLDIQEPMKLDFRDHFAYHRRTQSPQFNFLCGHGLSRLFKQQQLFEAVSASQDRIQMVEGW